jgi:hypothetical protein
MFVGKLRDWIVERVGDDSVRLPPVGDGTDDLPQRRHQHLPRQQDVVRQRRVVRRLVDAAALQRRLAHLGVDLRPRLLPPPVPAVPAGADVIKLSSLPLTKKPELLSPIRLIGQA